ncbi:MAG: hypothetical protein ABW032_09290 [Burkholderiaceae bacterium]
MKEERKTDWRSDTTPSILYFVHGTAVDPASAHRIGISPLHSRELLLVGDTQQTVGGGRMIFTFRACAGTNLDASAEKSAACKRLWGLDAHYYVFRVPAGTTYWSQDAALALGKEVAFEYAFDSADIVEYWAPSSGYVRGPNEANSPRTQFQKVPWHSYLASRTAALQQLALE